MTLFVKKEAYKGPIQALVLDWAGTAVDFGCMAPAAVFVDVFQERGIDVTVKEARQFMGIEKKEHIRKICALETVKSAWQNAFGTYPGESDIDALYDKTAGMMVDTIANHCDPIPAMMDALESLQSSDIKIGSCTGYVREMMDVLVPGAAKKGYSPDAVFCSSDVPNGRPYPWMCYKNAIALGVYPMEAMVKVGDTIVDIQEGLNAGMWTVGIVESGNEMGLTLQELEALPADERANRVQAVTRAFEQAGAHYVIKQPHGLPDVVARINDQLAAGEQPLKAMG